MVDVFVPPVATYFIGDFIGQQRQSDACDSLSATPPPSSSVEGRCAGGGHDACAATSSAASRMPSDARKNYPRSWMGGGSGAYEFGVGGCYVVTVEWGTVVTVQGQVPTPGYLTP